MPSTRRISSLSGASPEATPARPAAVPDLPPQFSAEVLSQEEMRAFSPGDMPDMPDFDAAAKGKGTPAAQAPASGKGRDEGYVYRPSDKTLLLLDELPWAEIKEETGLTKEKLIKGATEYGVLEAIAYGDRFTSKPLWITAGSKHQKPEGHFYTMRLWHMPDKETGAMRWGFELHPTELLNLIDEKGNRMMKDGRPMRVWNTNPVQPGSILKIGDTVLNQEQVMQIMLTGGLEGPLNVVDYKGNPQSIVVGADKFNNHFLVAKSTKALFKRLSENPVYKVSRNETIQLSPKQVGELSIGNGAWIKTQKGPLYIKYDVFEDRLRPATDYRKALRTYLEKENKEAMAKAQGKAEDQGESTKVRR